LKDVDLLVMDDGVGGVPIKSGGKSYIGAERKHIWDYARLGEVSMDEIWEGYERNLILVMEEVEKVVKALPGKIVITSDHGNHMGEYGVYGHEKNIRTEELVKVPWHMIKNKGDRIEPTKEKEGGPGEVDLEIVHIKNVIKKLKRKK
jgi:hypothetical protein